jgi:hypothetical protein
MSADLPDGVTPVETGESSGNSAWIQKSDLTSGEVIAGEITAILENRGEHSSRELQILTDEGVRKLYSCAEINRGLGRGGIGEGDLVYLRYEGKEENDDGYEEHQFVVGEVEDQSVAAQESDY